MKFASTSSGLIVLRFVLTLSIAWNMSPGWASYYVQEGKVTRFTEHLIKSDYSYSYGLAAADLDGDGDLDLTSSDTRNFKLYWLENDGKGGFREHFVENGDRLGVIGHITSDTVDRKVLADKSTSLNKRWFTTPRLERHMIGDLNADRKPDVVIVDNLNGDVFWYKNSGTPASYPVWQRFTITSHTIPGAYDVDLADLDGDGDLDVAVAHLAPEQQVRLARKPRRS